LYSNWKKRRGTEGVWNKMRIYKDTKPTVSDEVVVITGKPSTYEGAFT
jgi:hypothetical protein